MFQEVAQHLQRPGQEPAEIGVDDWLVVVSQTCDVVARRLEAEPLVEVLHCKAHPGKPRKGFRNLESTRHIDFRPNKATHADLVLTAHAIANRYVIPRELLASNNPDSDKALDAVASRRLLGWYALRAGRPSWPNSFCDRITRTAREGLESALDTLSDDIAEVRVQLAPKDEELPQEQPYRVSVFFVVDEAVWNSSTDLRQDVQAAYAEFVSVLKGCQGIELDEELSDVVSGNQFTWQDTQQTDLWDFANLSHRD